MKTLNWGQRRAIQDPQPGLYQDTVLVTVEF